MIINRIRAQNVLRYAELSIDLAEQGLIAISGQNESGKSSIGETVCFALFGRTFSIAPGELEKVVRWGENHCNVTLDFSVEDTPYVLSRFLDRDGNHSAKLALVDAPDEPVARGVQGVGDALFGILGYEYDEFVESFYLAQREITTPHPHSQAIKIMAGVAPLERVMHSLDSEIAERDDLLDELKAEAEAVEGEVQALGIQEGHMPQLEEQRHRTAQQVDQVTALIADIQHGLDTGEANSKKIARARGAKGRIGLLRFIVLVLALTAAFLWLLLTYLPQLPQAATARDLLAGQVPQWEASKEIWIAYLAAGLGVLFLLLWWRSAGLRRRIEHLREETGQLTLALARARDVAIEPIVGEDAGEGLAPAEPDHGLQVPLRPERGEYELVRNTLDQTDASMRLAREYSEREIGWLEHVGIRLGAQIRELDEEIEDEQLRLQEALNLSEVMNGLSDKREDVEQRIADRRRGLELLNGAVAHMASHFNRDVKELVARMLPLFTDGRYEHLQIDGELKVRVFSSEKRDFMDLEEVSSGTQRQIMLALRLALLKKLLSRTVKGRQFAFLDEPFAFFDQERTCHALKALAELGDDISQVWIVAQDFPEGCDVEFDTKVYCDRASDTLSVSS